MQPAGMNGYSAHPMPPAARLLRCCALFFAAWLGLVGTPLAQPAGDLGEGLKALLAQERLAGAAYAVVRGDETLVGSVGTAHAPSGRPLAANAKVHVGSVAKMMLALAALRLVTEERLDLDAPVQTYLPELQIDNPWEATSPVLVRHLMDFTSGLEDLRLWQAFSARMNPDLPLAEVVGRSPRALVLRTEPGSRASYSNLGFTLLGWVIESVVGERYEAWADRELLQPLGLADSSFAFVTQVAQAGRPADPRLAWGHLEDGRPERALPIGVRPAAQFTTTAADMARLARFMMGDGHIDGRIFIDPLLLRAMGQPRGTEAARAGLTIGYGLGLSTRDRGGAVGRCHGGNVTGYRAMFCLYPAERAAFFVAVNTDSETARYDKLDELLQKHLRLPEPLPAPRAETVLAAEWAGRYVPAPGRFESLALVDRLTSVWRVDAGPGGATLARPGGTPLALHALSPVLMRQADRSTASHVFLTGADGERYLSDGLRTFRQVRLAELAALWASVALGVAGLLHGLLAAPWRRWRRGTRLAQPAFVAVLALLAAAPLFLLQPWQAMGDLTMASGLLYAATLALPLAALVQATRAWRQRGPGWRWDVAAAAAVVQVSVLLAWWGLWPVATWQ
jgi:CubicO group peptidase (beta-lactamase class C family)